MFLKRRTFRALLQNVWPLLDNLKYIMYYCENNVKIKSLFVNQMKN